MGGLVCKPLKLRDVTLAEVDSLFRHDTGACLKEQRKWEGRGQKTK